MLEDKRLEKKLHHLKGEYDKIETVSDPEAVIYKIMNDNKPEERSKSVRIHVPYVASMAAVLLIGVFIGLSSILPSEENNALNLMDQGSIPEVAELDQDEQHGIIGDKKQHPRDIFLLKLNDFLSQFYNMAAHELKQKNGLSDAKQIEALFSLWNAKYIIDEEFRKATNDTMSEEQVKNIYDGVTLKLETLLENTSYMFEKDLFPLSSDLLNIYDDYSKSLDDELLRNLQPYEVMSIYIYASSLGDYETIYALYNKSEPRYYPEREEYLNGKIAGEKYGIYHEWTGTIKFVEQIVFLNSAGLSNNFEYDYDSAQIVLYFSDDFASHSDKVHFQLSTNDDGIWKVNWLPIQ
jgi:hypothetical protein